MISAGSIKVSYLLWVHINVNINPLIIVFQMKWGDLDLSLLFGRRSLVVSLSILLSVHHQRDFYLPSVGSHKRVAAQNTPGGAFIREIGSLQLLHVVPGSIYYYCKSPKPVSPTFYKTYRSTFLKGLVRGPWHHDNSSNYRWVPAFDTVHHESHIAAETPVRM